MKKVLLISETYSGGVKTYIDTLISSKAKFEDIDLNVLVSSKRSEDAQKINTEIIVNDNLSFGKSPLKLVKALMAVHEIVMKKEIDIIHANSTLAGVVMYSYSFFNKNLHYIYTPHGYYSFKKMRKWIHFFVRVVEKRVNKSANLIIHVSESEEHEAITSQLVTPEKSIVILNGAKDPDFNPSTKSSSKFTIVNLARVDDPKNPFEFIRLAEKIVRKYENIHFLWAGDGKYLEEARQKVKDLKMEEKIKFIGFTSETEQVLQEADLYFSTSYYEGLPFAVVEAISYKLPLMLTDIMGHRDIVRENGNGILFKLQDDQSVMNFIDEAVSNKSSWQSMSNQSYKIFKEKFSVDSMIQKLMGVYENKGQFISTENKNRLSKKVSIVKEH